MAMQAMLSFTQSLTPSLELYVSLILASFFLIKIPSKSSDRAVNLQNWRFRLGRLELITHKFSDSR